MESGGDDCHHICTVPFPVPWKEGPSSEVPNESTEKPPRALTGSPPEANEMDCMWWFAMVCTPRTRKETHR